MKKEHKHAVAIRGLADGEQIQVKNSGVWLDCTFPDFDPESEYRIKPAEPEKVYPGTRMSDEEMRCCCFYNDMRDTGMRDGLRRLADAAIRHAVDNGYLVLPPECSPSARDMAIAQAVAAETVRELYTHSTRSQSEAIRAASQNTGRLAEIIESVKP